jgi:hypothetical protein
VHEFQRMVARGMLAAGNALAAQREAAE